MEFLNSLAAPVGALAATWTIAHKLGGFLKARKIAGKALSVITYARENLVELNDLVFEIERAMQDEKITSEEMQRIVKEAADLARTLRARSVLKDAQLELSSMAPAKAPKE